MQPVTCMSHGQANAEITTDYVPTLNCNHEQPIIFKEASCQNGNELSSPPIAMRMGTARSVVSTTPIANAQGQRWKMNTSIENETVYSKQEQSKTYALAGNTIGREPHNGGNGTGFDESGASYILTKTDVHAVAFSVKDDGRGAGDISPTICNQHTGIGIAQNMQVRRLMPVECERLQGFADNYTNIPGASDSARYKALGNSMAVNCMAIIGQRIQMVNRIGNAN